MKLDPSSGHCMHCGENLPVLVLSIDSWPQFRHETLANLSKDCLHCGDFHRVLFCRSKYTGRMEIFAGRSQRCENTAATRPCGICNEWFLSEEMPSHVDICISRAWREPNSMRLSLFREPLRLATGLNRPLDQANSKPKRAPQSLPDCPRFKGWDLDEWLPDFPM